MHQYHRILHRITAEGAAVSDSGTTGRTGKPKSVLELRERAKLGSTQEIEWMLNVHTLQPVNTTFIRNVHSLQALNMHTGTVTLAAVAHRKRITDYSDIQIVLGFRG